MSLMSLITTGSASTATATTSNTTTTSPLQQLIASQTAAKTAAATTSTSTSSAGGVTISAAAKIAAAEAADNKKDFTALGTEVRATLDAQYAADKAAKKTAKADLSEMSGRALAAISLNKSGSFSATEVAAAKLELRTRSRDQFATMVGTGTALGAIATYNQQIVSQYDSMSSEERQALGWTSGFRTSAAAFVGTASQTSLFDQLGNIGDTSTTSTTGF